MRSGVSISAKSINWGLLIVGGSMLNSPSGDPTFQNYYN